MRRVTYAYKYVRGSRTDTRKRIKGDSRLSFHVRPHRFWRAIRRVVKNELIASSVHRYTQTKWVSNECPTRDYYPKKILKNRKKIFSFSFVWKNRPFFASCIIFSLTGIFGENAKGEPKWVKPFSLDHRTGWQSFVDQSFLSHSTLTRE